MFLFLFVILVSCSSVSSNHTTIPTPTLPELKTYLAYAYSSFCLEGLLNWTCYWCHNITGTPPVQVAVILESDGVYGTYGYIGASDTEIIIGFRGSSSINNWIHDADFFLIDYPGVSGAYVHMGFYMAYNDVAKVVRSTVKDLRAKFPTKTISVTGHSLGAALSVLCAADLVENGFDNVQLWTFGQPRVGNHVFSKYFGTIVPLSRRTVNERDLVPHLPPTYLDYHHTATEIWFKNSYQNFIICDGSGEDPACSDSVPFYDYSPGDHLLYLGYDVKSGASHGCGSVNS